jgi:hypothetical protein
MKQPGAEIRTKSIDERRKVALGIPPGISGESLVDLGRRRHGLAKNE